MDNNIIVNIISQTIAVIGLVVTSTIAIKSINKASQKNRIGQVYTEMLNVLVEQYQILHVTLKLLWSTSQRSHIYKLPENVEIDTGYNRYWKEIQVLSERTEQLFSKKNLFLPTEISLSLNEIIKLVNNARSLAVEAKTDSGTNHEKIENIVNEAAQAFNKSLNISRKYIGIDKLEMISIKDNIYLVGNENIEFGK